MTLEDKFAEHDSLKKRVEANIDIAYFFAIDFAEWLGHKDVKDLLSEFITEKGL